LPAGTAAGTEAKARVTDKLVPVFTREELTRLEQVCAGRTFAQRRDTAIICTPLGVRPSR
jgi:hypothetical protein